MKYRFNHFGENNLRIKYLMESKKSTFITIIYHQFIEHFIFRQIKQLYYPTVTSITFLITISVLLFKLPWPHLSNHEFIHYIESTTYQNYIAVHAGIGTIILALLILVAETSNSGKNSNGARLLLKETLVFPMVVIEVMNLSFFAFGIGKGGALLGLVVIASLTLASIYKLTKLLINKYVFQQKEQQLIKDRFSDSLIRKVTDRIAANTLLSYFKQSVYEINYDLFSSNNNNMHTFFLSKNGILFNIKLEKLEKLLSNLDKIANQQGETIRRMSKEKSEGSLINSEIDARYVSKKLKTTGVSLLNLIGDEISNKRGILEIPKSLIPDANSQENIQKAIDSIFILSSENTTDAEMRLELDEAKERAFTAINESSTSALKSVMGTYELIIDQFVNVLQTFESKYSSTSAMEERHSLFGGWSYIQWIKDDIADIVREVINCKNEKLLREIAHTQIKILDIAYEKKEHYIFQEFLTFQSYFYHLTQKSQDEDVKKLLLNMSSERLQELCEYKIASELNDRQLEIERISDIKDFALEIIHSYNNLLKHALDNKDSNSFKSFFSDLQAILRSFRPSEDNLSLLEEMKLKEENISEGQKKDIENNLTKISILEETEAEIKQNKDELAFGLAAWCLGELKESNFKNEHLLIIWNRLFSYLPKELNKLIKQLEKTTNREVEKKWDWTWWDLKEDTEQDSVVTQEVTFYKKSCDLFAVLLLKTLTGKSISDKNLSDLHIRRDLVFYFEKDESFARSSVIKIADNQSEWQKILSEDEAKSKSVALSLLSCLVKKQKEEEMKKLINTRVDSKKIKKFVSNFLDAYLKGISLRNLLYHFGAIKDLGIISKSKEYWGFNEIRDKEAFLESWHIDYGNFGNHYGRGLAESEDNIIFKKIRSKSKNLGKQSLLSEAITSGIADLESNNFRPTVIFTTFQLGEWKMSTPDDSSFTAYWNITDSLFSNLPHFIGLYKHDKKEIPVFEYSVSDQKKSSEIIISDLSNFVTLRQYLPYSSDSEKLKSIQKKHLLFKITDLSADSEQKTVVDIINNKPSWLEKHKNKIEYLKQKVIFQVKEKFEIITKDKKASVKISIDSLKN